MHQGVQPATRTGREKMKVTVTSGLFRSAAVAALLLSLVFSPAMLAGSPTQGQVSSGQKCLAVGKAKLAAGRYQEAVKSLEEAVKSQPRSCEAQLCLGQAYLKLKNNAKARLHLRTAVRVGQGSANAQKANACLMTLPRTVIAPRTGPETRLIALNLGLVSSDRGEGGAAKPTVLDFYASWCQPCKQLEPIIEKAKSQYGEKVNFMTINVDDPSNEQIIDQYGVSPIPTVVFLSPDGQVVTYSIGFAGEKVLENGLKKILKG